MNISMYKIFVCGFAVMSLLTMLTARAQDDIYPAKDYKGKLYITGATIHIGNGQVIEGGTIAVDNGKIVQVGMNVSVPAASNDVKVVDARGKQVYPGLILP